MSSKYVERLFIQPEKSLTVVNSDNAMGVENCEFGETQKFSNHLITGTAHPRTKIAPIIPARPLDITYWRENPMVNLSIINKRKQTYNSLAGYDTTELTEMKCDSIRDELYTENPNPLVQTIQPGVYTLPYEYEPINANLGISDTPQFEKISSNKQDGNVIFQQNPVRENFESIKKNNIVDDVSIYNVFDPRFSGYGSDNRNYLDPMLNQTRYYYDDIDAIRRPNYIVRSKLDSCTTSFGDQYGPMRKYQLNLNETRPLAEKMYLENNLNHRNDLMESLMSKRNSEKWQSRAAPKYTTRQTLK